MSMLRPVRLSKNYPLARTAKKLSTIWDFAILQAVCVSPFMLTERECLYYAFFREVLWKWKCQVAQSRRPYGEFLMGSREELSDGTSGQQAVMGI